MRRNNNNEIAFDVTDAEEMKDAIKSFFAESQIGKQYKEEYYSREKGAEHTDLLLDAVETLFGNTDGHITVRQMEAAMRNLILAGEIQKAEPEESVVLPEPAIDTTPRDKNGKPLTGSQLKWSEFRKFADQASMAEINLRKRNDPEFAAFVLKNYEREMQQEIGGAVVPEGDRLTGSQKIVDAELRDFARAYRIEKSENLRPKGGLVTLGGRQLSYAYLNEMVEKASAAGVL
jgi:hypothetical protein